VAPGHGQTLIAPAAGIVAPPETGLPVIGTRVRAGQTLLRLLAVPAGGDLLRTNEEVRAAEARARQATLEAQRAEQLFADRLISARERERAAADLEVARAALDAARSRAGIAGGDRSGGDAASSFVVNAPEDGVVRALHVGAGQTVAAGTPLVEVVRTDRMWVRVPVYVGDLSRLDLRAAATVRSLGDASGPGVLAAAQPAPPVADPVAASADLHYALPGGSAAFRPGARVQVSVPLRGEPAEVIAVPFAAVVYDYSGGTWVYERTAPLTYTRRRVALGAIAGSWAELLRGPPIGASVVTDGAAELFGTEFGVGK
jgi:RND family efflux transporter MFP subunit